MPWPEPIHLLVSDLVMPGISGLLLAERLASSRPAMQVLFITGYAPEAVDRNGELAAAGAPAREAVHRRPARPQGPRGARGRRLRLAPSRRAALPSRPMLPSQLAVTPPGALDLTGEAARRRRQLQRAAMAVLERAAYEELIPPTLEYQDTFLRAGGPGVAERLIRFPDRDGRILALRYDFTASLARVAATTFSAADRPLRLCYSGTVYRQEPERGGRPREMLQVGAELLGQGDLAADIEIVRLTIALVRAAGLQDFQVNLGHVGVLAPGIAALDEDAPRRRAPLDRPQGPWQSLPRAGRRHRRRGHAHPLPFVIGRREALTGALGLRHARRAPGSSTCWRSTRRSPPTSGRTWSTIWARCAASSTTPACTSRSTSPAPAAPPAPAAATTS